ncbi:hypothetical protein FQ775_05945 [Nitratireductor mangrovi]|uniref:Uncharacterized protein n=1 Tax=Nitratireductor mangrovi TaxID=2599600 RepID=A0A5B8KWI8_9HYPH|nr:hypothetical protein [Nitratireductor mangrovi]QDY99952.1 hypothetical protein FQ775_05945 [Nitratireductor mangrovi]
MADFVAVLKKTIDNLGDATPETREKVYQKARATVGARLAAMNPPPPAAVADRQRRQLEDAIKEIERQFQTAQGKDNDPLAELDALFAELTPAKSGAAKQPQAGEAAKPAAPPPRSLAGAQPATQAVSTPAAAVAPPPVGPEHSEAPAEGPVEMEFDTPPPPPPRASNRRALPGGTGRWLAAAVALLVIGGAGYGLWLNRDSFAGLFGSAPAEVAEETTAPVEPEPLEEEAVAAAEEEPEVAAAEPADTQPADEDGGTQKFTQRLNPDGSETDPGPAGGDAEVGEGTSLASATQPGEEPLPGTGETAAAAAGDEAPVEQGDSSEAAVLVGQKAIFYEERTAVAEGTADSGSVVWSIAQESPGADLPPEPAIRAEATIPDKDLQLRLTVRRNADQTLPASHIVELIFLTPENFASGPIDNVLRMTLKDTEQAAGSPLLGIPAKIADGFFLVALNDGETEVEQNLRLLRQQKWIDVPIVYKSGRRALITMEKGLPGEKVFEEALKAWEAASSG